MKKIKVAQVAMVTVFAAAASIFATSTAGYADIPLPERTCVEPEQYAVAVQTLSASADELELADEFELLYDIPLSEELQRFTYERCEELGLPYELVLGVMWKESGYDPSSVSSTGDMGIMQINESNVEWIMGVCGLTDIMDPEQNITAGTKMLYYLYSQYDDIDHLLMVYNMSSQKAKKLWNDGIHSSEYSRAILSYIDTLTLVDGAGPS